MSIGLMEARPPYVEFEDRSTEDREATTREGRLVMRPVHFVIIRAVGSRDSVEKEVGPWLEHLEKMSTAGQYRRDWVDSFRKKYEAWRAGQEAPVNGFPVREWASINKATADNLVSAGVLTVEDLAAANEQTLTRIGMGSRALKDKAQAWLDSATKNGNAEELAAMRTKVDALEQTNADLRQKLEQFMADTEGKRKRA